jgi:hypothetical protein
MRKLFISSLTGTQGGLWRAIAFYGLMLGLLAIPIFSVAVPPLGDYPNHLARMHILASYADSPALQMNYAIQWKPAPYLAMDLIVPHLVPLLSIYMAGQVFLYVCLMLGVVGTAAVHAALFRRLSPWPAASALFAYSFLLHAGLVSYLFGVGVWLLAFAGWIVLSRRSFGWRIAVGSLLILPVFFSHYFAFFGYGLCVAAYELGVWLSIRDRTANGLLRRAITAAIPAIVPLAILATIPKGQEGEITRYGTLAEKLASLWLLLTFPGARFDLAILVFAAAVLMVGLLFGRLRLAAPMYLPLIVLGTTAVAMPEVLFGVVVMDRRLPLVFLFLLIAGLSWRMLSTKAAISLAGVAVILLAANVASITWAWKPIGAQYDEFRAALPAIERGASVIPFMEHVSMGQSLRQGPETMYYSMPMLAVIERDAYLPNLFKEPMLPVAAQPYRKMIDVPFSHDIYLTELIEGADPVKGPEMLGHDVGDYDGSHNFWGDWPHHFDYAVELHWGVRSTLPPQLKLIKSGQIFSIYRIEQ